MPNPLRRKSEDANFSYPDFFRAGKSNGSSCDSQALPGYWHVYPVLSLPYVSIDLDI